MKVKSLVARKESETTWEYTRLEDELEIAETTSSQVEILDEVANIQYPVRKLLKNELEKGVRHKKSHAHSCRELWRFWILNIPRSDGFRNAFPQVSLTKEKDAECQCNARTLAGVEALKRFGRFEVFPPHKLFYFLKFL